MLLWHSLRHIIAGQIIRRPRGLKKTLARCDLGQPVRVNLRIPVIAFLTLRDLRVVLISAGDWLPCELIKYATKPATWGVAWCFAFKHQMLSRWSIHCWTYHWCPWNDVRGLDQNVNIFRQNREENWHTSVLPIQALVISTPGAKISTTDPKFENEAISSAIVVAPTVFAEGARAGLVSPASTPSFPAATVTWIPASVS